MKCRIVVLVSISFVVAPDFPSYTCDWDLTSLTNYEFFFEPAWVGSRTMNICDGGWGYPKSVAVNSYDGDCFPWKSADGQYLLFASINLNGPPRLGHHGTENWDIYISEWNPVDSCWGMEVNIGSAINTGMNERRPSCTINCDTLYFDRNDDIYISTRDGKGWTEAAPLDFPVNTTDLERHPAISADSKRLYFTSDRIGGQGGLDIWIAYWDGSAWSTVENMGAPINTVNEETRPFESFDEQRFYFSNNHGAPRPGGSYGGASDIYVSTWNDFGWGPVELVAAPVNNDLTACSPYESADGSELWIGSEAWEGGRGDEDIWVATKGASAAPRLTRGYGNWVKTGELTDAIYVYDLRESETGVIYAATACAETEPTGRVFKTNDGGRKWTPCADLPGTMIAYSLVVHYDTLYVGTFPNGDVFKSTNRGNSWVNTADLPEITAARSLVQLRNGDILVGTSPYDFTMQNRIFRTRDGGTSWVPAAKLPHINPCKFLYQTMDGTVFAGGWGIDNDIVIQKSENDGVSWDSVIVIDTWEPEFTVDGFYETRDSVLYVSGWTPAHGPGNMGGFVYKSVNRGVNWSACSKIMRGDGVHNGRVYSIVEDNIGTVYVGMQPAPDSVVFATSDCGNSWFSKGGLDGAFECLCLMKASDGSIYAGTTPNGDVFRYVPRTRVNETRTVSRVDYALSQNFPNPFNSSTVIRFQIASAGRVKLGIYDLLGREVRILIDGQMGAGWHRILFDGIDDGRRRISSGVYIYRLETGGYSCMKKCLFLR